MVRNSLEKSGIFKEPRVGKKGCSIAETVEDRRQKRRKKRRVNIYLVVWGTYR